MSHVTLRNTKTYTELSAYWEFNSFGTQFITYVWENLDGSKLYSYSHHDEGDWLTTKDALRAEYLTLIKHNHVKGERIFV